MENKEFQTKIIGKRLNKESVETDYIEILQDDTEKVKQILQDNNIEFDVHHDALELYCFDEARHTETSDYRLYEDLNPEQTLERTSKFSEVLFNTFSEMGELILELNYEMSE